MHVTTMDKEDVISKDKEGFMGGLGGRKGKGRGKCCNYFIISKTEGKFMATNLHIQRIPKRILRSEEKDKYTQEGTGNK